MIIEKLKLNPFGAVKERVYSFEPGLNVLFGPNEAGKSTLVNALFAVLFLPPDLRRNSEDWKKFLARCLPHPGGDTCRVSLQFQDGAGERGTYTCSWGERREARLLLENGAEINNPAAVRERLLQALSYGRATYEAVLFARQDEMERTLERLRHDGEASRTIAGTLRRAVIEAGGVSLEELEAILEETSWELLQNWDLARDGPKNNRGIDNPYIKGVGRLLAVYYESERLRRRLQQTRDLEKRAGDLAGQLEKTVRERAEALEQLGAMELLEKDIRRRFTLEPQLEKIEMQAEGWRKVLLEWPRAAGRAAELARNLEKDKEKLDALKKELEEAGEQQAAQQKRELLRKAGPLQARILEIDRELSGLVNIGRADLHDLKEWQKKEGELKAVIEAMKLRVRFVTRRPLEMKVTAGLELPTTTIIEQKASFKGAGRLLLESPDWLLEVQSGEGDVESLLREIKEAREYLEERLNSLGVQDIAAAEAAFNRRENLERERAGMKAKLEVLLGENSYSELEQEVAALPEEKEMRDTRAIQEEITALSGAIAVGENTLLREQQRVEEWAAEHGSPEELSRKLGELERKAGEITAELGMLAPLPEGFSSADEFMAGITELRRLKDKLQESISSLRIELIEVRKELPEESAEELAEALSLSEEKLARLKEEARALQVVAAEFQALKDELDSDTFEPLARSFARYLAPVTGWRYTAAELDGVVPGSIIRAAGEPPLPVELLSTGTAGGVALALRLAVAEYLLEAAAGFMIMDDPLVYLDPERKAQAAAVLQEFARKKQLIVTTCDPATADLLGGNIIRL